MLISQKIIDKLTGGRKPDFVIGHPNFPYLKRWWVIPRNKFFNIYLHNIVADDEDRAYHDHPWINVSIPLRGVIRELRMGRKDRDLRPGRMYFRLGTAQHRLVVGRDRFTETEPMDVWSLFITGPKYRQWGFICSKGWVHWKEFTKGAPKGQTGAGCGED